MLAGYGMVQYRSGIVGRGFGVVIITWERHAGLFDFSMDHYYIIDISLLVL